MWQQQARLLFLNSPSSPTSFLLGSLTSTFLLSERDNERMGRLGGQRKEHHLHLPPGKTFPEAVWPPLTTTEMGWGSGADALGSLGAGRLAPASEQGLQAACGSTRI